MNKSSGIILGERAVREELYYIPGSPPTAEIQKSCTSFKYWASNWGGGGRFNSGSNFCTTKNVPSFQLILDLFLMKRACCVFLPQKTDIASRMLQSLVPAPWGVVGAFLSLWDALLHGALDCIPHCPEPLSPLPSLQGTHLVSHRRSQMKQPGTLRMNQTLQQLQPRPGTGWVIALDPVWDHKKGPELALRGTGQRDRSVIFLDEYFQRKKSNVLNKLLWHK